MVITVTREQLVKAYTQWEQDWDDGKTIPAEEYQKKPLQERAEGMADALINYLEKTK